MSRNSILTTIFVVLFLLSGIDTSATNTVATKAMIRGDGTLLVDGKSIFPTGVRTESISDIKIIADCGFNLVEGSGEWGPEHYAEARKHNLLILAGHYVWATFRGAKPGVDPLIIDGAWGKDREGIKNLLKHAKDQSNRTILDALEQFDHLPGVIGWKIAEEPKGFLCQVVDRGYEVFKSYSPNHIMTIQHDRNEWFANFQYGCDVLELDVYTLRGDSYPARRATSLFEVYERVKRAQNVMNGQPVWFVGQVQPPSYWKPFNTEEELSLRDYRLQNYLAYIAGAKGLIYYHWSMMHKAGPRDKDGKYKIISEDTYNKRIEIIKQTVQETKRLAPILCNGNKKPVSDLYIRWTHPGKNGPGAQLTNVIE
ncbi:MAG: hypothetical protein KAH12_07025 [Anaerolineales bacterium]|nr:hypothetical protein [Anaerolineales bacterium]